MSLPRCPECWDLNEEDGLKPGACNPCLGTGKVDVSIDTSFTSKLAPCPDCKGTGKCSFCGGRMRVRPEEDAAWRLGHQK